MDPPEKSPSGAPAWLRGRHSGDGRGGPSALGTWPATLFAHSVKPGVRPCEGTLAQRSARAAVPGAPWRPVTAHRSRLPAGRRAADARELRHVPSALTRGRSRHPAPPGPAAALTRVSSTPRSWTAHSVFGPEKVRQRDAHEETARSCSSENGLSGHEGAPRADDTEPAGPGRLPKGSNPTARSAQPGVTRYSLQSLGRPAETPALAEPRPRVGAVHHSLPGPRPHPRARVHPGPLRPRARAPAPRKAQRPRPPGQRSRGPRGPRTASPRNGPQARAAAGTFLRQRGANTAVRRQAAGRVRTAVRDAGTLVPGPRLCLLRRRRPAAAAPHARARPRRGSASPQPPAGPACPTTPRPTPPRDATSGPSEPSP